MFENDDDALVMESTTDTPEQIAEGLGVQLEASAEPEGEAPDGEDLSSAGEASEDAALDAGAGDEPAPVAQEVTPDTARVEAPKSRPGTRRARATDGAAAAARRTEAARRVIAETERDAALERIKELTAGKPLTSEARPAATTTTRVATVAAIKPEQVPDTHPEIAEILARRQALGPKPKQDDFADFEEYETKLHEWLTESGALRGEERTARKGVAARLTTEHEQANRAVTETMERFAQSRAAAKARHADYDAVMDDASAADVRVLAHIKEGIAESDIGGELTYYLAKNTAELDRIQALPPVKGLVALGALEGRIRATMPRQATTTRTIARTTRAPLPQESLVGDGPAGAETRDLNDPSLSMSEYNRLRNEMDEKSGRRVSTTH